MVALVYVSSLLNEHLLPVFVGALLSLENLSESKANIKLMRSQSYGNIPLFPANTFPIEISNLGYAEKKQHLSPCLIGSLYH